MIKRGDKTTEWQLSNNLAEILEQEMEQMSTAVFLSTHQRLGTLFNFNPDAKNPKLMVPKVRSIVLPKQGGMTDYKEDINIITKAVEEIAKKDNVVKKLSEGGYSGLNSDEDYPLEIRHYILNMILGILAEHNLSIATLFLEQEKALAALEVFASPQTDSLIDGIKQGQKKAAVILHSAKETPITYTVQRSGDTEKIILNGTGSLVIGGKGADVFVVMAVDKNGMNRRMFVVEENQGISAREVKGSLGLEEAGFADVTFNNVPAVAWGSAEKAYIATRDIERRGLQAIAIGVSKRIAQEAERSASQRRQGPAGHEVPNLYHAAVHRMIEEIIERTETIAGLDVTDPLQMHQLIRLMARNGDEGVQVLGGGGLDEGERIINGGWRGTATLLALEASNLQLDQQIHDEAMRAEPESVKVEIKDGVASITINRPELLNAMGTVQAERIAALFENIHKKLLDGDQNIKSIIFTSNETGFIAGGDLKELISQMADYLYPGTLDRTNITNFWLRKKEELKDRIDLNGRQRALSCSGS